MKSLIVTADDFGLSPEVNRAIEIAHREGILDAASLMVSGAAAADAVAIARRTPSLRVGLHVVLVDGAPTLPPPSIPDLVTRDGRLRCDMARLGSAIFFRRRVREQLAAEIVAQLDAFAATGLPLDHVNAHHHFHVHPTVASTLIGAGRTRGLAALRVPREPASALAAVEPQTRARRDARMAPWLSLLERRARRAQIALADRTLGVAWSGAMIEARLAGLVRTLTDGVTEIFVHPATADAFDGATPGYRYRDELAALTSPAVREAVRASGARRGGFADVVLR